MNIAEQPTFVDAGELADMGVALQRDVPLAPYTTMKIGGPADLFATVATLDQLKDVVLWARSASVPYFVLGGGSNMLISDAGIRGLVIYNRCRQVAIVGEESGRDAGEHGLQADDAGDDGFDAILYAESGAAMAGAARKMVQRGFAGLEWAVSLPGTVGGAVVGNAGAYGGEVKDNLVRTRIIAADGREASLRADEMAYAYRSSVLKRRHTLTAAFGPVVLDAYFGLRTGDIAQLREQSDQYLAHRRRTQPVEPSLGSTFVNPPGDHAGRLIEAAGLKGASVGGVRVSETHANFLVNPGGAGSATAGDVMKLVQMIQDTVRAEFQVELVREIQLAGEW